MARVAWVFAGYSWPVNPEKDSGWIKEEVYAERNALNSTVSNIHFTAKKSARRKVSGWLFGESTAAQLTKMQSWKDNRTIGTLVDHVGGSKRCIMISFEAEPIQSVSEWKAGRQTYKYNAEFVEVS
jgi:hypothetical protein